MLRHGLDIASEIIPDGDLKMIKFQGADGRDRLWGYSNSTPVMKRLEESYRFALTAREQIATHRAHLGSTGKYTPQGIATEIHRYARENMLPGLGRARLAVQQAKRQLAERRQRIKPAAPDKQDVVGFFRRDRSAAVAVPRYA
jgi:hypothetical protein